MRAYKLLRNWICRCLNNNDIEFEIFFKNEEEEDE